MQNLLIYNENICPGLSQQGRQQSGGNDQGRSTGPATSAEKLPQRYGTPNNVNVTVLSALMKEYLLKYVIPALILSHALHTHTQASFYLLMASVGSPPPIFSTTM